MVYLGIFQDCNVKGGLTARHYLSVPNPAVDQDIQDVFHVDDSESLADIWERVQHVLTAPAMNALPVFEEKIISRKSDAISLDQLLLNGAIGGRRLTKIMCLVLSENGEPLEFVTYKIFDFKYRRMVPL